jgi:hypothetical protein
MSVVDDGRLFIPRPAVVKLLDDDSLLCKRFQFSLMGVGGLFSQLRVVKDALAG